MKEGILVSGHNPLLFDLGPKMVPVILEILIHKSVTDNEK